MSLSWPIFHEETQQHQKNTSNKARVSLLYISLYAHHIPQVGWFTPYLCGCNPAKNQPSGSPYFGSTCPLTLSWGRWLLNLEGYREYLLVGSCQFQPFPLPYESSIWRSHAICKIMGLRWVDNFQYLVWNHKIQMCTLEVKTIEN